MNVNFFTAYNPFMTSFMQSPVSYYNPFMIGFIPFTSVTSVPYYNPASAIQPSTFNIDAIAKQIMNNVLNFSFTKPLQLKTPVPVTYTRQDATPSSNETSAPAGNVSTKGVFLKGKGKGTQYGPEFLAKVKKVANNLNCDYRDLIAIFNSEFGVEANKTASNGAVGLICFMPQFFDTKKIVKMTPLEQLDVVEETIMRSKKRAGFAADARLSKADLYALVFLPARANREVLCQKGEGNRFYESNAALDYNKDGKITKTEMAHRIDKKYVSDQSFLA